MLRQHYSARDKLWINQYSVLIVKGRVAKYSTINFFCVKLLLALWFMLAVRTDLFSHTDQLGLVIKSYFFLKFLFQIEKKNSEGELSNVQKNITLFGWGFRFPLGVTVSFSHYPLLSEFIFFISLKWFPCTFLSNTRVFQGIKIQDCGLTIAFITHVHGERDIIIRRSFSPKKTVQLMGRVSNVTQPEYANVISMQVWLQVTPIIQQLKRYMSVYVVV